MLTHIGVPTSLNLFRNVLAHLLPRLKKSPKMGCNQMTTDVERNSKYQEKISEQFNEYMRGDLISERVSDEVAGVLTQALMLAEDVEFSIHSIALSKSQRQYDLAHLDLAMGTIEDCAKSVRELIGCINSIALNGFGHLDDYDDMYDIDDDEG